MSATNTVAWAFGAYTQTHEDPVRTNTMEERTIGYICLGITGNLQGSYTFLNLTTGKLITRRKFTPLPMPNDVIDRVIELVNKEKAPKGLQFADRHQHLQELIEEIAGVDAQIAGVEQDNNNDDRIKNGKFYCG